MSTRTSEERAIDLLLELVALDAATQASSSLIGATVFQKIIFWSKLQLYELSLALPRVSYRRHYYGPFSEDVAEDLEMLRRLGHVDKTSFRITARGAEIVRHWTGLLESHNHEAFAMVRKIAAELAPLTAGEVKERTYDLPAERVGANQRYRTVEGIPQGVVLLLRRARPLRAFEITPELNADLVLEISMTADVAARLARPSAGPRFQSIEEAVAVLGREPNT